MSDAEREGGSKSDDLHDATISARMAWMERKLFDLEHRIEVLESDAEDDRTLRMEQSERSEGG